MQNFLPVRKAAAVLGISYSTLKQWIYRGRLQTIKTMGGHHRVPETEIDRLIPSGLSRRDVDRFLRLRHKISGRNQLVGRVLEVKYDGLIAQVTLAVGEQHVTSIITADAARELRLKPGERAAALVKSTEVMILRVKFS